jgi:uncharacterized integral membrane protein
MNVYIVCDFVILTVLVILFCVKNSDEANLQRLGGLL